MFEIAAEAERLRLPFAIVTIISTEGIVPRKSGRMLVLPDGTCHGTVGGGHVERYAARMALEAIGRSEGGVINASTPKGNVVMKIDIPSKGRSLHVIGAGHVGLEIAHLMYRAGYAVYIYDINPVSFENAALTRCGSSWDEVLDDIAIDSCSAIVVSVHEKSDIEKYILPSAAFYTGFLSSRVRAVGDKKGVYVPMGLDIGAETPEEIAISVASEIMAAASACTGNSISRRISRTILVRGAGDIATGVIIKLHNAGYDVIATDLAFPTQIRRSVSFAEAIYEGECIVEGVRAVRISEPEERFAAFDEGAVPVIADPSLSCLESVRPQVVVDAILAKRNIGTSRNMAPLVIGLGPGFEAGCDVDLVIETMRGHELGRIIREGSARPNTGIPGIIAGYGSERVVRSPSDGIFHPVRTFGDIVSSGDIIAYVGNEPVRSEIDGMVRGMLHEGLEVSVGFKVADVDPRGEGVDYTHVSDKARCIAGGVLEAVDAFFHHELRVF